MTIGITIHDRTDLPPNDFHGNVSVFLDLSLEKPMVKPKEVANVPTIQLFIA